MLKLLYYATLYVTFSYLKDVVFLLDSWKVSLVLNDFVRTVDVVFIPLVSAFFLEAVHPGRVTSRQLTLAVGFQSSFIPLFLLFPIRQVVLAAMAVAYFHATITIVYVLAFAIKHHRAPSANCSCTGNLNVTWVTLSCVIYFFSLFFYSIAFENTTWLSESLYNLFTIVFWLFLIVFTKRHRIVEVSKVHEQSEESVETVESKEIETDEECSVSDRNEEMAVRIEEYMKSSKIYLNPHITLNELALAIGTNRTYLSECFNTVMHTNFYDYINTFRIAEACRIIDAMPQEGRKSMQTVSEMSGFNSKSTFHRYFVRIKGISPKQYALAANTKFESYTTPTQSL
ncbi:MAG: helix-turn-helix domain-containing protein [Prevotella sp.]